MRTAMGTSTRRTSAVDNSRFVHRTTRRDLAAGDRRRIRLRRRATCPYAAATVVIPNPQHLLRLLLLCIRPIMGRAATVKFRCERDVLADALATAGRAATSRTGALPVLEGSAPAVRRRRAVGHRHRPRDVDPPRRSTVGGVSDGAVVVPARLSADAVKSLARRAPWSVSAGDDDGHDHAPGARSSRCAATTSTTIRPRSTRRPRRSRCRRRTSPTRCARWSGRRAPTRPAG